jgi:hypothetical protein
VNRDVSNDSHNYPPIVDEYFDRSPLEFVDSQEAVVISRGISRWNRSRPLNRRCRI